MTPPEPIEGLNEVTHKARRALWWVFLVAATVCAAGIIVIWSAT